MIGLILGTAEGKNILSLLNEFTKDILVSTATVYGGDLLKDYKYILINTKPLNLDALKDLLIINNISLLIDASHPYATEITTNCKTVCAELNINYLRYERASVAERYRNNERVIFLNSYENLKDKMATIEALGTEENVILNTTGSKNIGKILSLGILNRIVHRVLPSVRVMKECLELGVKVDDIIAIKGPIGYDLNVGFIRQYNAKALILKDSGLQGGTEEKIKAALSEGLYVFVIERKKEEFKNVFYSEESLVKYIKENNLY